MLWVACVLPTLFPYLFITFLLSHLNATPKLARILHPITSKLFGINGVGGYALFISLMSGYPVGSKTVAELRTGGFLSKTESERASVICSTSSPSFLISSVGGVMFNSPLFGVLLFAISTLSCFVVGVVFSFYKRKNKPKNYQPFIVASSDNLLYDGVYSSVVSVLVVGGIITIFYTLTEILMVLGALSPFVNLFELVLGNSNSATALTLGAFECTKGLKALVGIPLSKALPVASGICGLGGFSVIMQSLAFLKKAKIKTTVFLVGKLLTAVFNVLFGLLFSVFL